MRAKSNDTTINRTGLIQELKQIIMNNNENCQAFGQQSKINLNVIVRINHYF